MTSDAQKKAMKKYREKIKKFSIEFPPTEAELYEHLNKQPKKQTYIKNLIREDMNREKGAEKHGESVNGSIQRAIVETMERDNREK